MANVSTFYQKPSSKEVVQDTNASLMSILKERVIFIQLAQDLTYKALCDKYELKPKTDRVFIELQVMKEFQKKKDIHCVILLDKVVCLYFFIINLQ